ncbi:hypothetical protein [Dryocola sp. BD613]|uniref:hypothetical protein n=1 Tax=Dryocola sp. BD613 TaxID=3133272 RepID=UPI003F509912
MTIRGQVVQPKRTFQEDDKPGTQLKGSRSCIPASWQLSKQQQEFIDLFTADDHKKQ